MREDGFYWVRTHDGKVQVAHWTADVAFWWLTDDEQPYRDDDFVVLSHRLIPPTST